MKLSEKLQYYRLKNNLSQEQLAEKIMVSRQAVAKWEAGQSLPEIDKLILLSQFFQVSMDKLVKEGCGDCIESGDFQVDELREFLIIAKQNTYAVKANEAISSRPNSHDFRFEQNGYLYIDTYLGGDHFSGEEAVWHESKPIWSMNYSGRVLSEEFSGDFLKEVLMNVTTEHPYRGPLIYRVQNMTYHCVIQGSFEWYQGYEEIYNGNLKTYECYFHGGIVK